MMMLLDFNNRIGGMFEYNFRSKNMQPHGNEIGFLRCSMVLYQDLTGAMKISQCPTLGGIHMGFFPTMPHPKETFFQNPVPHIHIRPYQFLLHRNGTPVMGVSQLMHHSGWHHKVVDTSHGKIKWWGKLRSIQFAAER